MKNVSKTDRDAFLDASGHQRLSERRLLVYPVFSRRAGGLSLGINVNPDKKCDFNCVYCQVDRSRIVDGLSADASQIAEELEEWLIHLAEEPSDSSWRLKDISFAGDGEPTMVKSLPELIRRTIELKSELASDEVKIVLFSNGSRIDRRDLSEIWPEFFAANGEIWLKLDFWDEQSLKRINRTGIPAERLLKNITNLGRQYPLVLQSCFFSWKREEFRKRALRGYIELVRRFLDQGVQIKLIQAYTLARTPNSPDAAPWSNREMDELGAVLRENLSVKVETFYQNGK